MNENKTNSAYSTDEIKKALNLFLENTKYIEEKIKTLNLNVEAQPLKVKKEIDKIFENEETEKFLNRTELKVELLKIKAKSLLLLGDDKEFIKNYNEIIEISLNEINYSQDDLQNKKKKEKKLEENIIEKFNGILSKDYKIFTKEGKVIEKEKIKFEEVLLNEASNLKEYNLEKIGDYFLGIFYAQIGNSSKSEKLIESSANLGFPSAINIYLGSISNFMIGHYKSLEKEEDKQKFKKDNLEQVEQEFLKFINGTYKGNTKLDTQVKYTELYESLGNLYENIGEYNRAFLEYKDGIKSSYKGSYKLHSKIADLYIKGKIKQKLNNSLYENLKKLYESSADVGDFEYMAIASEKLGDYYKFSDKEESNKYYNQGLNVLINSSYHFEGVEKIVYRIMNKGNVNSFLIKNEKGDLIIDQYSVLQKIISEDSDYLIVLADKYEQESNIEYAFYNYLLAYQLKTENSKDALGFFIDTSLRDFIKEEKNKFLNQFKQENQDTDDSEIIEAEKLNNEEFEIKEELLNRILKAVDKNEILERESIATLFDLSIDEDFYNNFNINNFNVFLEKYKNNNIFSDIFLHRILENVLSGNGTNMQSDDVKKLLRKIYLKKELGKNDLELIYNLLNLEIETDKNSFKYTYELNSIRKKGIK